MVSKAIGKKNSVNGVQYAVELKMTMKTSK